MYTFIKKLFNKQTRKQSKNKNKKTSKAIKKKRTIKTTRTKLKLQNKNTKKEFNGGLNDLRLQQGEIENNKRKNRKNFMEYWKTYVRNHLEDLKKNTVIIFLNELEIHKNKIYTEIKFNESKLEDILRNYKSNKKLLYLVRHCNTQKDKKLADFVQQENNRGWGYKYFNDIYINDINKIQAYKEIIDYFEIEYKNAKDEYEVLEKIWKVYINVIKDDNKIKEIVDYVKPKNLIKNQNQNQKDSSKDSSKCINNGNLCKLVKCDEENTENFKTKCKIHKYVVTKYANQSENEYNDIWFTDLKNNARRREDKFV
tara:strand:- start:1189 stop:2124 length:936 start_codon:yes stop_codon:yes gene_type:complete